MANQKPPSADYKVVKAQVQEQRFLKKLLLDRQGSVSSLSDMGREMAKKCSPAERAEIEDQLKELIRRFDALNDQAADRMKQLEDAMKVRSSGRGGREGSGREEGGRGERYRQSELISDICCMVMHFILPLEFALWWCLLVLC